MARRRVDSFASDTTGVARRAGVDPILQGNERARRKRVSAFAGLQRRDPRVGFDREEHAAILDALADVVRNASTRGNASRDFFVDYLAVLRQSLLKQHGADSRTYSSRDGFKYDMGPFRSPIRAIPQTADRHVEITALVVKHIDQLERIKTDRGKRQRVVDLVGGMWHGKPITQDDIRNSIRSLLIVLDAHERSKEVWPFDASLLAACRRGRPILEALAAVPRAKRTSSAV